MQWFHELGSGAWGAFERGREGKRVMNLAAVESIAKAVLYEGYILYPYRPSSIKNRQRWTFGSLFPGDYVTGDPSSASSMKTECLLRGGPGMTVEVRVRFLHLVNREIGQLPVPLAELSGPEPEFTKVASLRLGTQVLYAWEEATERDVTIPALTMAELTRAAPALPFSFSGQRSTEQLRGADGLIAGVFIRTTKTVRGEIAISATEIAPSTFKLIVKIRNTTPLAALAAKHRTEAQHFAFASTHTILSVEGGAFLSLLDPPEDLKDAAAGCANEGTWPVLAGKLGSADTMLSSPIILYDYPQVAPESPGDLFDASEIDEILTMRILCMTSEEKREMTAADPLARALLERTEALTAGDMERLHGALRDKRFGTEQPEGPRPGDFKPRLACLRTPGKDLKVGDRVRLRPKGGADIMDIILKDELAVIEAIERDFEDRIHIAVVLEADPGRELGLSRMPGHRFFFSPEEIEAAEEEGRP
jgi:hypothetical protein